MSVCAAVPPETAAFLELSRTPCTIRSNGAQLDGVRFAVAQPAPSGWVARSLGTIKWKPCVPSLNEFDVTMLNAVNTLLILMLYQVALTSRPLRKTVGAISAPIL